MAMYDNRLSINQRKHGNSCMEKPQQSRSELYRLVRALRHSLHGYRAVWRDEIAFRVEFVIFIILVLPAWLLARSWTQFGLLLGAWLLVLTAELGNSAVEAAIDRIGPEKHDLSAKAKDAGSAMVLTVMLLAGLVWLMVILDRIG